ncbi:MAG: response regulator [Bdellovibrionota bacterium]
MSQTVLVIDSNAAVQAITALALNQTDCAVETLSDGAQAYARIRALKPTVVLCAKEISGIDPFELCRKVKSELKETAFVMLAPAEAVNATSAKAKEYDYDEVLFKPFKSNRLREVVTGLFERGAEVTPVALPVFAALGDQLRRKIVARFIAKHGGECLMHGDSASGNDPKTFRATLIDSDSQLPEWLDEARAGKVIVLGSKATRTKRFPQAVELAPPLTGEKLFQAFGPLPTAKAAALLAPPPVVDEQEKAVIAAQVSAQVFQRLLIAHVSGDYDWDEIAHLVHEEVLRYGAEHSRKKRLKQ